MASKMKNSSVSYSAMNTSAIVNTVRAAYANGDAVTGINFADRIPECNQQTLNTIGEIFMGDGDLANAFIKEIFNRIGLVDMNYRRYENNLKLLKIGRLEFGESVEEIAFGLVKGKCDYKVQEGVTDVFQITLPKVASAIHKVNFQQKYPQSITRADLRKAFTSESSLGSFIDGIMTGLYNSYEVDEQLAYKNLITVALNKGFGVVKTMVPVTDEASGKTFVKTLKSLATKLRYMSDKYSAYGLPQFTPERDLLIIMDSETDASISVDVLAAAFNMSQVEFMQSGIKIVLDEFPVEGVHAMVCDRKFFQIYDNDFSLDSIYNPSNRVWNYFLHVWEVISASPFMNCIIFTEENSGTVTSVTVNPATATVAKGSTQQFTANVESTGAVSNAVGWSVTGTDDPASGTTVSPAGLLTIDPAEKNTTLTVTATSVATAGVAGTATVTVS